MIPYGKCRPIAVRWEPINSYTLLYLFYLTVFKGPASNGEGERNGKVRGEKVEGNGETKQS